MAGPTRLTATLEYQQPRFITGIERNGHWQVFCRESPGQRWLDDHWSSTDSEYHIVPHLQAWIVKLIICQRDCTSHKFGDILLHPHTTQGSRRRWKNCVDCNTILSWRTRTHASLVGHWISDPYSRTNVPFKNDKAGLLQDWAEQDRLGGAGAISKLVTRGFWSLRPGNNHYRIALFVQNDSIFHFWLTGVQCDRLQTSITRWILSEGGH